MSFADEARALDAADPLAAARDLFVLPEGVIYLDGNSLGALPRATAARVAQVIEREWGARLIRSWNSTAAGAPGWIDLPQRVGAKIAPLIGAASHEVIACDSTSVNLFKLLGAALALRPGRRVIVSEPGSFPTDLYMIQGLQALGLAEQRLAEPEALMAALDDDVAAVLLSHVHYKTGQVHDMAAITAAAHAAGALAIWDLSHSAGAIAVDLSGSKADMAVGCGYKFLNGGPGAPAFLYVAEHLHAAIANPLPGWMGHAAPFAFTDSYAPAAGVARMLTGTPPILGLAALDCGVETIAALGMPALVAKSAALSDFFGRVVAATCPSLERVGPPLTAPRGNHVSLRHPQAYAICQALIARGVIGDFRDPDILRFGLTPAYLTFGDLWRAAQHLAAVLDAREWDQPQHQLRLAVT